MTEQEWRGEAHRVLPRYFERNLRAEAATRPAPAQPSSASMTMAGLASEGALRGIPAIGRGVSGAIAGTNPLHAIAKADAERRRREAADALEAAAE